MAKITVFPDSDSLSRRFHCRCRRAGPGGTRPLYAGPVWRQHSETGVLSTGNDGVPEPPGLAQVQIFFGDERCVPPDDPQNNYMMARTALLDQVPIPAENIHRTRGEDEPEEAARSYAKDLQYTFGGDAGAGKPPPEGFDLILLGIGDNSHTASLFPGLAAVTERERWVMAQYVEVVGMWRLTLTPVVFNAARQVAFLVSGANKAGVVRQVLEGPYRPVVLPAQSIRPGSGDLHWLLDAAAAAKIKERYE